MKFKEILNEDEFLFEMANLTKKNFKSLPANLYISTRGNAKHGPRIKIQQNYDEKIKSKMTFSMTIPDKEIIGDTGDLDNKDIKYFENFIDNNKELLIEYWNNGENMDTMDVINSLVF